MIDPLTRQTTEIARLSLPARPRALVLSSTGLFAIGEEDGSVLVMTQDGTQNAVFQATTNSIENLSFSPDGHFLAVASAEGVRVYAILPAAK